MKKLKILTMGIFLILLTACHVDNENQEIAEARQGTVNQRDNVMIEPVDDEEITDALTNLEPMIRLISDQDWDIYEGRWQNRILLLDLATGAILASHEFNDDDHFGGLWDLGEGYYGVHVWEFDENNYQINPRIVVFDQQLTIFETIFYVTPDDFVLWNAYLKFQDGELFAYLLEVPEPGSRESRPLLNPLRFNFQTGEIEILVELEEPIAHMHQFVGEHQIFVTEFVVLFDEGEKTSRYGILDLEAGITHFFEKEDFAYGRLDFRDDKVLISESPPAGPQLRNEVIVFEFENMTSEIIQLTGEGDSIYARFSYDGDHIVTINEESSTFRKYDMNGLIINEIEIVILTSMARAEEMFDLEPEFIQERLLNSFEIFPISEQLYVIHTTSTLMGTGIFLSDLHIQAITLP